MIILDLDNCISDDSWRIDRINWKETDMTLRYRDYHLLSGFDATGNQHLYERSLQGIIILTARPDAYAAITEEWLRRNKINWEAIFFRHEDQHANAEETKRVQLLSLPHFGIRLEEISMAYDDRPEVVEMYRKHGVPAQVAFIHKISPYEAQGGII